MISTLEMFHGLIKTPVSTIYLLLTISELAGVNVEILKPRTNRESLVYLGQGGLRKLLVSMIYAAETSYSPYVSLRYENWKFNRCTLDPDQLFKLESEPFEKDNLASDTNLDIIIENFFRTCVTHVGTSNVLTKRFALNRLVSP